MKYVIKKDGTLEPYDEQKIINAVYKSAQRALTVLDIKDYEKICQNIILEFDKNIKKL